MICPVCQQEIVGAINGHLMTCRAILLEIDSAGKIFNNRSGYCFRCGCGVIPPPLPDAGDWIEFERHWQQPHDWKKILTRLEMESM